MLFWLILFGIVTKQLATKYGIPYLFLDPEYLNKVNWVSYLIVGFSIGGFIMAFNISSYVMNAFRFPFLATLSNPFLKFCLNNFILPSFFIVIYCWQIIKFQHQDQLADSFTIFTEVISFLGGILLFIFLSATYFFSANKDISKMFGIKTVEKSNFKNKKISRVVLKKNMEWKTISTKEERDWHVETYISNFYRIRLARGIEHYDKDMLIKVLKQNHRSTIWFEIFTIITLLVLSLVREVPFFAIPAGASVVLLLTLYLLLSSATHTFFRGWSTTMALLLIVVANVLYTYNFFNFKSEVIGLNYNTSKMPYTLASVEATQNNPAIYQNDVLQGLQILSNWGLKNSSNENNKKPKLVFLNCTGGGLRSALWTFYSLQQADSIMNGDLLKQIHLITGASGGMVGAAYMRELYLLKQEGKINSLSNKNYVNQISSDVLNPVIFSIAVNDLFFRFLKHTDGKYIYTKDRGFALESTLSFNTGGILAKKLFDYKSPELESKIPMMIFTPSILNDGRKLFISPQPISYLFSAKHNRKVSNLDLLQGVEFSRFFAKQDAENLSFLSALRMNASFPFVSPVVNLPSEPVMEVADAGGRDNYGLETTLAYIKTFKKWIEENTSGIVIIQIRDRHKINEIDEHKNQTLFQSISSPVNSLYGNLFNVQDYNQDQLLQYASNCYGGKIDVITFQMRNSKKDNISLSWHLTEKEKQQVLSSIDLPENIAALKKLKVLLE
ncbi:MAG: hypothetical protein V4667_04750 [Bacteroidota bacterium]